MLGAGGIRGCAHAGVIGVLREAGIPIHLVVGASVGSIFGLALAAGISTSYMHGVIRNNTPFEMFRFYASRLRADRRNPIAGMLRDAGAGKTFADLDLPFTAMATDMETGVPTPLTEGPVLRAVEASIALPIIARSVAIGGRHYVDGGVVDTAPVHVARAMGADIVIAVCLGINYTAPTPLRTRPWTRPLVERLGRQRRPVRGRFRDQVRFGCRLYAASYDPPFPAEDADIAIWPRFGTIGPNSMRGAALCLDAGIEAAHAALPAIQETLPI